MRIDMLNALFLTVVVFVSLPLASSKSLLLYGLCQCLSLATYSNAIPVYADRYYNTF